MKTKEELETIFNSGENIFNAENKVKFWYEGSIQTGRFLSGAVAVGSLILGVGAFTAPALPCFALLGAGAILGKLAVPRYTAGEEAAFQRKSAFGKFLSMGARGVCAIIGGIAEAGVLAGAAAVTVGLAGIAISPIAAIATGTASFLDYAVVAGASLLAGCAFVPPLVEKVLGNKNEEKVTAGKESVMENIKTIRKEQEKVSETNQNKLVV